MRTIYHPALLTVLTTALLTTADVRFLSETIAITILPPDTLIVHGEYCFTTEDSATIPYSLYYPFPVDSVSSFPFFISVVDKKSASIIKYNDNPQGILFNFPVTGGDTAIITVTYKQRVKQQTGRYILTTTANWGEPLEQGRYSVRIPSRCTLSHLSYVCDSVERKKNHLVYRFEKTDFMPVRDLTFIWAAAAVRRTERVVKEDGLPSRQAPSGR
ncbi:MAG: DUF4424 family protein [Chitinispirillaceae bacterium]|nr:DUF4424 family protein [Chitinispirillaceae bacterium]